MSGVKGRDHQVVIGGSPRVDLLPPEVKLGKRQAAVRRRLVMGVVLIFLVTAAATGVATIGAIDSQSRLASAQARTTALLAEQAEFSEVRQLASEVDAIILMRPAAVSTEVNWQSLVNALQSTLPAGVVIGTITADVASPIEMAEVPSAALEGQRVGTVSLLITTPGLGEIATWLQSIRTLDGYVDARLGSATTADGGGYEVAVTIHIGTSAYSERFLVAPVEGAPAEAAADDATTDDAETEE